MTILNNESGLDSQNRYRKAYVAINYSATMFLLNIKATESSMIITNTI